MRRVINIHLKMRLIYYDHLPQIQIYIHTLTENMRIKKLYCPWDTDVFGPQMLKKYDFDGYYDPYSRNDRGVPIVVFGCYGRGTKNDIMNHPGLVVIVWSGSDSTRLHEVGDFVHYIKDNTDRIFHIAHSHWIQTDLKHWGIPYIDRVVFPVDLSSYKFEEQQGKNVYHYGSKDRPWFYGSHLMRKLRDKWSKPKHLPKVIITNYGGYGKDELYEIYKDCFVGVRLTEHDNMALSCVELGLMGRCLSLMGTFHVLYSTVRIILLMMQRLGASGFIRMRACWARWVR